MRSSYASMMMVVGLGLGCVALGAGCVAQADSDAAEESAEAPVGEASEALCRLGAPCPPPLGLSATWGAEKVMDSWGNATSTSPDAAYNSASPWDYILQANVPAYCAQYSPLGSCMRWAPSYPSNAVFADVYAPPQGLLCSDTVMVSVTAQGWDPALNAWVSLGSKSASSTGICGTWSMLPNAGASLGGFNLATASSGRPIHAIRVHGTAWRWLGDGSFAGAIPISVSTANHTIY